MTRAETLSVRTPEGVTFRLLLAGPFHRMTAFLIDFCVVAAVGTSLQRATSVFSIFGRDASEAIAIILYFIVSLLYAGLTEWLWRGQTIGKRLMNLRVVDADGLRLRPSQVVIRNLMRSVDLLPGIYLVGATSCFFSSRGQRLGDLAARTAVIRIAPMNKPGLDHLQDDKFNSLAAYRHLTARLRQKVGPALASVALEAIMRRDELAPDARLEVFRDFSEYFKTVVPYPPDATDQIPDEQYVRNVVALLFKKSSQYASTSGLAQRDLGAAVQATSRD